MPNEHAQSNDDALPRKIAAWLEQEGFPLEMRVARAFRGRETQVVQSDYYDDPEGGGPREIDVTVRRFKITDSGLSIEVSACVECKMSPSNPWVAFSSTGRQLHKIATTIQRSRTRRARRLLVTLMAQKRSEVVSLPMLAGNKARRAYGITPALGNRGGGKDHAFAAITVAAKAAVAQVHDWESDEDGVYGLALPVVVLGGRLFEASLDSDGAVQATEVERVQLVSRQPISGSPHTFVDVVTEAGLPDLVRDFRSTANWLLKQVKAAEKVEEWFAQASKTPSVETEQPPTTREPIE